MIGEEYHAFLFLIIFSATLRCNTNEPGKENNPAEIPLPGLGILYFPDEWPDELEKTGRAKRFLLSGAWSRTEELVVSDSNCDGNWADGLLNEWSIRGRTRPSNWSVSHNKNYQTVNYNWIYGDLWIVSPQYIKEKLIPN